MTPVPLFLLAAWATAATTGGPVIDKDSCSESDAKMIEDSWPEARKRTKAAAENVGKAIAGEDASQRAKIVAYAKLLGVGPGDLPDVARILGLMDGQIENSLYVCGAKSDKHCANRGGYVRRGEEEDGRAVVHLCPGMFKDDAREQRVRTMTHESAHLVDPKISQPEGEGYCILFDCEMSCPGKTAYLVADNWAQFTHCASGQKPDDAFEIVGSPDPAKKKSKP